MNSRNVPQKKLRINHESRSEVIAGGWNKCRGVENLKTKSRGGGSDYLEL